MSYKKIFIFIIMFLIGGIFIKFLHIESDEIIINIPGGLDTPSKEIILSNGGYTIQRKMGKSISTSSYTIDSNEWLNIRNSIDIYTIKLFKQEFLSSKGLEMDNVIVSIYSNGEKVTLEYEEAINNLNSNEYKNIKIDRLFKYIKKYRYVY